MTSLPNAFAAIDIEAIDPRVLNKMPCFGLCLINPQTCATLFKKAYYVDLTIDPESNESIDLTDQTDQEKLDWFYSQAHPETAEWLKDQSQLTPLWLKCINEGKPIKTVMSEFMEDINELRLKYTLTFASDFNAFDLAGINSHLNQTHQGVPLHTPVTGSNPASLGFHPHVDTDSWKLGLGLSGEDPCQVWASDNQAFQLVFDKTELVYMDGKLSHVLNPATGRWCSLPIADHHPENDAHYIAMAHCLLTHGRARFQLIRSDRLVYRGLRTLRDYTPTWFSRHF